MIYSLPSPDIASWTLLSHSRKKQNQNKLTPTLLSILSWQCNSMSTQSPVHHVRCLKQTQQLDVPEWLNYKLVSMVHNCLHHKAPHGLLHSYLQCGQSTTSSFCQSSSSGCAVAQSQHVWSSEFRHSLLVARLPGTHRVTICVIRHLAQSHKQFQTSATLIKTRFVFRVLNL